MTAGDDGSGGGERVPVDVAGRTVVLTHLGKEWWPGGDTKGECLHYYARIAPLMVPGVAGRPASFLRAPDGVGGQSWVAKHLLPGTPDWVPRTTVHGRDSVRDQLVLDDAAALLWAVNAGCLEIHVPQYRGGDGAAHDRIVFDLDPGPGTDLTDCCRVALRIRALLAEEEDGLPEPRPVVSGKKGLHLYVDAEAGEEDAVARAHAIADRLAERWPDEVTAVMAKKERHGKVFVDWSQNRSAKTTAAPYTLRAAEEGPSVAAPVGWDEVEACRSPEELRFGPVEVLDRAGIAD